MSDLSLPVAAEIARIVQAGAITPHFQPIVDLGSGAVLGYEGLTRGPSDSFLHSPITLFEAAEATGQLFVLERCAIERHRPPRRPGQPEDRLHHF